MITGHTTLGDGGRIVIPAEYREKMQVKKGDTFTFTFNGDGLHISTSRFAIGKMQKLLDTLVPPGVSLADELIAERRQQAKQE